MKISELRKIIKEEVQKKVMMEGFHPLDDVLAGITFQDLIVTVQSNEKVIDERAVSKVFNEMLKTNIKDAKYELKRNMKQIIGEAT